VPRDSFTATGSFPEVITLTIPVKFGAQTHLDFTLDQGAAAFASAFGGDAGAQSTDDELLTWGGITGVFDDNGAQLSSFSGRLGLGL